jgi:tetratricopeptide (TPR) repeat protein
MMKEILEIPRELKGLEWISKRGGFVYALSLFFLSSTIISILAETGIPISSKGIIAILLGLQIIHLIIWLIKRNYFYDANILTVAFAITTEETSQGYYKEIKKKFREQIATYKLQDDVKIKELPPDINFSDAKSAEAFILKKGIRLLVWGDTTEGNLGNALFSQFNVKLSYQYQHGAINKEKQKKFVNDIQMAIQRRMWGIRQPDSFFHLAVVSGNIFEISLYTLGTCLATVPNVSYLLKSVDIFEKLQSILRTRKQDINFPNLQFVKQKTRSFLRDAYTSLLIFYGNPLKNLDKAIEYADKAIKIDENNFNAHQNMAVFQWLKGDKHKARFHTERAWRIRPGHPLPRFNKAFLFIYDRKYEPGLKQYKKIQYTGDTNIVDVIEFLEKEFEKFEDNLGLLFVAGWLNIQYADQIRGNSQIKEFLERAGDYPIYAVLVAEAQKVLLTIETN